MFADDVMMPTPGGTFAEGKAAAVAALQGNADNATSHIEWTPVRGGISADGRDGFTLGFMTLRRADGTAMPLKYLAYWVKRPGGWRVAVYKRTRAATAAPSLAVMPPILPQRLVRAVDGYRRDRAAQVDARAAERSFSPTRAGSAWAPRSRSTAARTPCISALPPSRGSSSARRRSAASVSEGQPPAAARSPGRRTESSSRRAAILA
jgi:ketosteroid isomerase-like protein